MNDDNDKLEQEVCARGVKIADLSQRPMTEDHRKALERECRAMIMTLCTG